MAFCTGKSLLVTGATGGIGKALSELAISDGYTLIIHYHTKGDEADRLISLANDHHLKAYKFQADLSKELEVENMFSFISEKVGRIQGLVNNAGTLFHKSRLEDMEYSRLKLTLETNILNYMLCCKYAIKQMSIKHGGNGGSIVNVSSAASRLGSPNEYVDYACSKGAIDSLTIGLANELCDDQIRVNCVRPGFIYTDIHSKSGDIVRVNKLQHLIPLKRGGQPFEVAEAIMWFISEKSSYSTGAFLDVAGGK
ncbi:MAG: SDR family oxidoreductase [Francisellaceae bacterium]